MRHTFLCCSIIIMLDTMLITRCTCSADDVMSLDRSRTEGTKLWRSTKHKILKEENTMVPMPKFDFSQSFAKLNMMEQMDVNLSTPRLSRKYSKRKIPRLYSKRLPNISSQSCTQMCLHASTCKNSSRILNFKTRKKQARTRAFSLIRSSHIHSSSITSQTYTVNYINSSELENKSQHLILTLQNNKREGRAIETLSSTKQRSRKTRKRKADTLGCLNNTTFINREQWNLSFPKHTTLKVSIIENNSTPTFQIIGPNKSARNTKKRKEVDMKPNYKVRRDKKKLLREELIRILKNKSRTLPSLEVKRTRYTSTSKAEVTFTGKSTFLQKAIPAQNADSRIHQYPVTLASQPRQRKAHIHVVENFLYSGESHVMESGNESLLNDFQEIPLHRDSPKAGLKVSEEIFLYVPKNSSTKRVRNTTRRRVSRLKCNTSNTRASKRNTRSNITKSKRKLKTDPATLHVTNKESTVGTFPTDFDLCNFLLYLETTERCPVQQHSTSKSRELRTKTTNLKFRTKKPINWKKFLMSAETIGINEVGPTVNVFSETSENEDTSSQNEQMSSKMITLDMKNLPDTQECIQMWNRTFGVVNSSESNEKSHEICTCDSIEAINIIKHNYSELLIRKAAFSGLSTVHPLLNPLATKFDDSILPNDKEAKIIFSNFMNESFEKLEEKFCRTRCTEGESLEEADPWKDYDFEDKSLSQEWKEVLDALTTPKYTVGTEFTYRIPDTSEAAHILKEYDWPDVFKEDLSQQTHQYEDKQFGASTLSMKESNLIFSRLGIELLGERICINTKIGDQNKMQKVLRSNVKKKIPNQILRNKEVEGYLLQLVTEDTPTEQGDISWESESPEHPVLINFNMKTFLSKLCAYLSDWKQTNQTQLSGKKPENSFLVGKPIYFKKRKNALI